MSWALSCLEESQAEGHLEPSPPSTGLCSLMGAYHPLASTLVKYIVHRHPINSWNGLKKRLIPLFKSLVEERGKKSYIWSIYDPIFSPQCKQIFWIPFNKPANGMSTKSHNKKPTFRVVYFPLPNLKYQKREGRKDHHMLNYTLS